MTSVPGPFARVIVDESSKVGEARRRAVGIAESLGFTEAEQGNAALIVTEAATNLIKHGGGGELIIQEAPGHCGGPEPRDPGA